MQYIVVLGSVGVDWPAAMAIPVKRLAWLWSLSFSGAVAVDCVLHASNIVPVAIQRVLFYATMPLALLVLLFAVEAVVVMTGKACRKALLPVGVVQPKCKVCLASRFCNILAVVAYCSYPGLLVAAFSMFSCIPFNSTLSTSMQSLTPRLGRLQAQNAAGASTAQTYWVFDMSPGAWARHAGLDTIRPGPWVWGLSC